MRRACLYTASRLPFSGLLKLRTNGAGAAFSSACDTASLGSGWAEATVVPVKTLAATSGTQIATARQGRRLTAARTAAGGTRHPDLDVRACRGDRARMAIIVLAPFSAKVDPLGD